jgi:hypothetical protein
MASTDLNTYSISLPIFQTKRIIKNRYLVSGKIIGSCFPIGENYFLTAGHVINEIQQLKTEDPENCLVVGLVDPSNGLLKSAPIIKQEELLCDCGLVCVDFVFPPSSEWIKNIPFMKTDININDKLRCFGYPYGLNNYDYDLSLVQRYFEGHLVSSLMKFKPLTYSHDPFPVYEISFNAPAGLSGSPLICYKNQFLNCGMIIGNSQQKMLIFETQEIIKKQSEKLIVEYYESLSLGIAIKSSTIVDLNSSILGKTIGKFIDGEKDSEE